MGLLFWTVLFKTFFAGGPSVQPWPRDSHCRILTCQPPAGYAHCIEVRVFIEASPEVLFSYITDIENNDAFFPEFSFRRVRKGALKVGEVYYSRMRGRGKWRPYRVTALETNRRLAGELVGKDPWFRRFSYDHRLEKTQGGTFSVERVAYRFRWGVLGQLLNALYGRRLIGKMLCQAHQRLKHRAEAPR